MVFVNFNILFTPVIVVYIRTSTMAIDFYILQDFCKFLFLLDALFIRIHFCTANGGDQ